LTIAWKAGVPFFAVLLFAYVVVSRRSRAETDDPPRGELAARQSTPAPGPTRDPDLVPDV
jgi:hypothetical protein